MFFGSTITCIIKVAMILKCNVQQVCWKYSTILYANKIYMKMYLGRYVLLLNFTSVRYILKRSFFYHFWYCKAHLCYTILNYFWRKLPKKYWICDRRRCEWILGMQVLTNPSSNNVTKISTQKNANIICSRLWSTRT